MINELERFKKVVDIGNITKASAVLFITQPALTQSIHRLEKEFGHKLLVTSGKRVELTPEGAIVYEFAEKILQLWYSAKRLNINSVPKLSIGLFDSAALKLSTYIQSLISKNDIELIIDRSESLLKKLNYGFIDICVCVLPADLKDYPNVLLLKEFDEKLVPVSGIKWEGNVENIPFISYDKGSQTGRFIDSIFLENRIKPNIIAKSVNPLYIKDLAIKNYGIGILPFDMVRDEIENNKLIVQKLPIKFKRACGVFKRKDYIDSDDGIISDIEELL